MASPTDSVALPPAPDSPGSPTGTSVRRHHTISASSRIARNRAPISEEESHPEWNNEDEVVSNENWSVGGAGAVGSGLHRAGSLPSRFLKGFNPAQSRSGRRSGNQTPLANSLSVIASEHGAEGEDDWERDVWSGDGERDLPPLPPNPDDSIDADAHEIAEFDNDASLASAGSGVRRHVSLTYGAQQAKQRATQQPLKRSGTMLATISGRSAQPSAEINDEEVDEFLEEEIQEQPRFPQLEPQVNVHPSRHIPWSNSGPEWRNNVSNDIQGNNGQIDELQRSFASLEMSHSPAMQPPRFSGMGNISPAAVAPSGLPSSGFRGQGASPAHHPRQLSGGGEYTSSYVPPIGQGLNRGDQGMIPQASLRQQRRSASNVSDDQIQYPVPPLKSRQSNPNIQYGQELGGYGGNANALPSVPQIPSSYVTHGGQPPRLGTNLNYGSPSTTSSQELPPIPPLKATDSLGALDVPTLIAAKGYNPVNFDCSPAEARYFVIKSYTEDDVHKSLKYEIWSSTDPGNKRLDKAFKECAGRGPIYLFFSVNASGHFCGVAEMLTPLDYTRSSTVWASDKWKGVFKVRWIFVRDIPNNALRHIKLLNTQERKPVTNSRDTQELLPEAGQEMLRIFSTHPARTSLLQDFAFYELQSMQKQQQQESGQGIATDSRSPPPSSPRPPNQAISQNFQQHPFAMTNTNSSNPGYVQTYPIGNGAMRSNTGYSQAQTARNIMREQPGTSQNYLGTRF